LRGRVLARLARGSAPAALRRSGLTVLHDRVVVHDDTAAGADLAGLAERLEQAEADLLTRHLHEAERGDLRHLVLRTVAAEALDEAAQDEVTVRFEHHVDEVDDDDAADVAQAQLADDLLGRLEVVFRDGLFEVAAGSDELARVDVDDRHRLGAVDDERAARRQPGLAVERLLDLLRDAEFVERVVLALVLLDALEEVGSDRLEVSGDRVVRLAALDDHLLEVFVEDIAHDLDEQIGLRVEH